ncbi:uncharacterized protein LOC130989449 [Salvia miltiorrhiza]|uniref:uncharacterized protein LOC130989449 n=1 Tax=Salvia miltiorrhiza TaxID=226208 RepID=UPI0025AC2231|nr:uncharacterized protein LOC130989449 [Salvia miltiorrhiza]
MAMQNGRAWTKHEEEELLSILHYVATDYDPNMGNPSFMSGVIDEIEGAIGWLVQQRLRATRADIISKVRFHIERWTSFQRYLAREYILRYDKESNEVIVCPMKFTMETETAEEAGFRLDGFPDYARMEQIMEAHGIESVPWDLVV